MISGFFYGLGLGAAFFTCAIVTGVVYLCVIDGLAGSR